jgi:hypothetical protein
MIAAMATPAERTAEYVLARVRELARHRWYQGERAEKLTDDCRGDLAWFAQHRLWGVGELESRGLVGWAAGTRTAELYDRVVEARELVELQAQGRRCVSLLEDAAPQEGLEFVLHDLRHLEKLFDPPNYRPQIGFFRMFARAYATGAQAELDRTLDATWSGERDRILADMNGCPIFLLAVLKMKLKVAVRRKLARERGVEPPARSRLSEDELAAYVPVLEQWLEVLGFSGDVRAAAREISTCRDRPDHGRTLLDYFATAS